jgi:hypothetical protein
MIDNLVQINKEINVWRLEPAINQTAASGYMEPAYS